MIFRRNSRQSRKSLAATRIPNVTDPENIVLQLLRDLRADMATKSDIADLRSEMQSLRADVASDLILVEARLNDQILAVEKRLNDQIIGLRRAVMEYHSSAIGHGVLITDFEERLRRIEQVLNLPSSGDAR